MMIMVPACSCVTPLRFLEQLAGRCVVAHMYMYMDMCMDMSRVGRGRDGSGPDLPHESLHILLCNRNKLPKIDTHCPRSW